MIDKLSILIPVYNDDASLLVNSLVREAQKVKGLEYEVVVYDDGSTDSRCIEANKRLSQLSGCRYVAEPHHTCRAAMRNAMLRQGKYEWCLMVDVRLQPVSNNFISNYVHTDVSGCGAVCGGVVVKGGDREQELYLESLRFRYEKYEERNHDVESRRRSPYQSFRTTNIMLRRSVLQQVPYDERIIGYGYEDVMLGKSLEKAGVKVLHIDNPVAYTSFESNLRYIEKLEEALNTLHAIASELQGYSPLLSAVSHIDSWNMLWSVRCMHRLFGQLERCLLSGNRPKLFMLKLYKLGYYASLR